MKTIIFTGGGTAGHIIPNIALIDELKNEYRCCYVGAGETEKNLINSTYPDGSVKYYGITARKFKRKLSLGNLLLPFSFIKSIRQVKKIINETKPSLIFSKGGYVALPLVIAGRLKKVPVITHESDLTLGLSNKISKIFCKKLLTTFPETAKTSGEKAICCGSPIRKKISEADRQNGLKIMNFDGTRKIITVVGGSLGAAKLNSIIYEALPELTEKADVFLITGKGKADTQKSRPHFKQREFVKDIFDVFAASSLIISRAGGNTICEICSIKKPLLLIPLKRATRGEQMQNASYFAKKNCALTLDEDTLTAGILTNKIFYALENETVFKENQSKLNIYGTTKIIAEMREFL